MAWGKKRMKSQRKFCRAGNRVVLPIERLEDRRLLAAFVSISGSGNWSALSSWATQDGVAASRIPTLGDTVTINGIITVNQAASVGTGSGDVLNLNAASTIGGKKLIVNAPLTVRGNIKFATNAVVDVQAGAGIELDANAGQTPLIHTPAYNNLNLYFHGTAQNRAYLRTKPGTAGNAGQILADYMYWTPVNLGATYTDFSDLNAGPNYASRDDVGKWGIFLWPSSSSLMNSIDHSTFTRTSFWMQDAGLGSATFTFSDNIFSQSALTAYYDQAVSYAIVVNNNVSLLRNSFDMPMYTMHMKDVVSNVFLAGGLESIHQRGGVHHLVGQPGPHQRAQQRLFPVSWWAVQPRLFHLRRLRRQQPPHQRDGFFPARDAGGAEHHHRPVHLRCPLRQRLR